MAAPPRLLDDKARFDWLRLLRTEGVGPRTFFRLFAKYGGASAALEALPSLSARSGKKIVPPHPDDIMRELDAAARMGVRFVARGEAGYPPALRAIDSAPPMLAIRGHASACDQPCVAIVGSRNASASGMRFAETLAAEIGGGGYSIVSGLARGIDAKAHAASLLTGTVAVLAGGHDRLYPREHDRLLDAILERGAAISEMPMGWTPRGRDFPRRNRIVSGMSLGVIVVEAALRSGSLITARFAAEQGRDVFAVPGSPLDPRAAGTNGLLRDGATICCAAADVLDALAPLRARDVIPDHAADPGLLEAPADIEDPLWDELDADVFGDEAGGGLAMRAATAPLMWSFEENAPSFAGHAVAGDDADLMDDTRAGRLPAVLSGMAGIVDVEDGEVPEADLVGAAPDPVTMQVTRLLGPAPLTVDDLVRLSGISAREINVALVELDLDGWIERHGAQAISLRARG